MFINEGKLLMLIGRGHKELWTPGGKIDEGETDEECLKRELKEELGVELLELKFFKEYVMDSFYRPGNTTIERAYIIKIQGELKPDAEIERIVWCTKQDYQDNRFPMITHTQEELIPDLIEAGIW